MPAETRPDKVTGEGYSCIVCTPSHQAETRPMEVIRHCYDFQRIWDLQLFHCVRTSGGGCSCFRAPSLPFRLGLLDPSTAGGAPPAPGLLCPCPVPGYLSRAGALDGWIHNGQGPYHT